VGNAQRKLRLEASKGFALTWYRALTRYFLRVSSLRTPFRALESCRHAGAGLPCCPVTSSGTSGAANGRAGEEYQNKARYQVRANPMLVRSEYAACAPPIARVGVPHPLPC